MNIDAAIVFNIVWISGVLAIAYIGIRKGWLKEKAEENEQLAREKQKDKALEKIKKSYVMQYIPLPEDDVFPSFESHGYELADLAWYAMDDPPNPPLPTLGLKRKITPNSTVRLGVIHEPEGEPVDIWVEVTAAPVDDCFTGVVSGILDPSLEKLRDLPLRFHANHIAEITSGDRKPPC